MARRARTFPNYGNENGKLLIFRSNSRFRQADTVPEPRMNQPIVYALVAMVCYGLSDFTYKRGAAVGIRAEHFLMAQAWVFCPLVILYALTTHTLVLDPAAI